MGKRWLARMLRNLLAAVLISIALIYVGDYAVLRYRIATNHSAFGSVHVRVLYAVPQKNRSTQYLPGGAGDEKCVHALFPHLDQAPCWYLARHAEERVDF